jgi:hypothetical protein
MRFASLGFVLLATSCAAIAPPRAPSAPTEPGAPPTAPIATAPRTFSGSVDFYYGVRALDEGDWSPVENQVAFGIETVLEQPDSFVGFEFGLFGSWNRKDDVTSGGGQFDVTGRTTELSAGLHKTFHPGDGPIRPYVGGGISAIRAGFRGEHGGVSETEEDGSLGLYLHGGVSYDLSANLFLAFDLRALGGTQIEIFGSDASADYGQAALVLGVRF